MIRVADFIAQTLADHGIRHVFMLTGGGAMHLNDAFGREQRIQVICNHHEQACAIAAEGYARLTGYIGVLNVTSGPGGINAINGVYGGWTDSIPMLVISGQVKRETYKGFYNLPGLRQLGDQEADIISIVKSITKYSVTIFEPNDIRFHLERAIYLASHGRPGPCWLDIPIDVQSAIVNEADLRGYDSAMDEIRINPAQIKDQCIKVLQRLNISKRPVILAGSGVRCADAVDLFNQIIQRLGIPVTTAWTHDTISSDNPLFCGRPGTIGDRAGNFVVQNADTLLILGSRLNIRQVSYNWNAFARYAYKIQVDIDPAELAKPTIKPEFAVHCDVRIFLEILNHVLDEFEYDLNIHKKWLSWCQERRQRYFGIFPHQKLFNGYINPYHFLDILFKKLSEDDVVICGNATATVVSFQVARLKLGQRLISNSGAASMGYDLPAALGAAVARDGKRVICLAGDGSIHLNIQELQTVVHHKLPIKIFVLNNNGYLSIRTTQSNFFKLYIGESPASGVSFPDYVKLSQAYGISSLRIDREDFSPLIDFVLSQEGPILADVILDPTQVFEPKLSSRVLPDGKMVSAPLEDMYPFLPRIELLENLFIPPWDEDD
jgi:acetolactate synthase-1/2/3 large subunit